MFCSDNHIASYQPVFLIGHDQPMINFYENAQQTLNYNFLSYAEKLAYYASIMLLFLSLYYAKYFASSQIASHKIFERFPF